MRALLFVVALAGCTHAMSSGPAWPKERAGGEGGETLAPREAAKSIEVALENDDDDDKPAEASAEKPAGKPAPVINGDEPAAAAPAATEEPITTDEIVIEVGGDD